MSIEDDLAAIEKKVGWDPTGMKVSIEIGKYLAIKNYKLQEDILNELKLLRKAMEERK